MVWNNKPQQQGGKFTPPIIETLKIKSGEHYRVVIPFSEEIGNVFQMLFKEYKLNFPIANGNGRLYSLPDASQYGVETNRVQELIDIFFDKVREVGKLQINGQPLAKEEMAKIYKSLNELMPIKQTHVVPINATAEDYSIPAITDIPYEDRIRTFDAYRFLTVAAVFKMDDLGEHFIINEETGLPEYELKLISLSQSVYHNALAKSAFGIGSADLERNDEGEYDEVLKNYLVQYNKTIEGDLEIPDTSDKMTRASGIVLKAYGKQIHRNFKNRVLQSGEQLLEKYPNLENHIIESIKQLNLAGDEGTIEIAKALYMYLPEQTIDRILIPFIKNLENVDLLSLLKEDEGDKPIDGAGSVNEAMDKVNEEFQGI